jgi:hypothetical protein
MHVCFSCGFYGFKIKKPLFNLRPANTLSVIHLNCLFTTVGAYYLCCTSLAALISFSLYNTHTFVLVKGSHWIFHLSMLVLIDASSAKWSLGNRDMLPVTGERQENLGLAGEHDEGQPSMWAETQDKLNHTLTKHKQFNIRTTQPQNNTSTRQGHVQKGSRVAPAPQKCESH